jgi:hypothetical protein
MVAGCSITTTQEKDARLEVKAERELAAAKPLKVKGKADDLEVTGVWEVRDGKQGAIAVGLRNTSDGVVNDIPLAVGVKSGSKRQYLNTGRNTPYYATHLLSLAPGAETTWVYVSKKPLPDGDPFAEAGAPADPPVADSLPEVTVGKPEGDPKKGEVRVSVTNGSDVPQYGLELYAWAPAGKGVAAAGTARIGDLDGGAERSVRLRLIGKADSGPVEVAAPPTIFK